MNSKVKFTKIGAGKESFTFRSCVKAAFLDFLQAKEYTQNSEYMKKI